MLNLFDYTARNGHTYHNCHLCVLRYGYTNNIALALNDENCNRIMIITTSVKPLPDNIIAIKNYSENGGIEDFLKQIGIIEEEPLTFVSSIPLYLFTSQGMELVKQLEKHSN